MENWQTLEVGVGTGSWAKGTCRCQRLRMQFFAYSWRFAACSRASLLSSYVLGAVQSLMRKPNSPYWGIQSPGNCGGSSLFVKKCPLSKTFHSRPGSRQRSFLKKSGGGAENLIPIIKFLLVGLHSLRPPAEPRKPKTPKVHFKVRKVPPQKKGQSQCPKCQSNWHLGHLNWLLRSFFRGGGVQNGIFRALEFWGFRALGSAGGVCVWLQL